MPQDQNQQYNEFWLQETASAFKAWSLTGATIEAAKEGVAIRLAPVAQHAPQLSCSAEPIDGGAASFSSAAGLCAGHDPFAAGSYNQGNYYNGGAFYYGTLVSPVQHTRQPITTLIASWNAVTPAGTWLETHVRVLQGQQWSHWYALPIWASDTSTVRRHSVDGQSNASGSISTDTFVTNGSPASAYQLSITLFTTKPSASPELHRVAVIASHDSADMPLFPPDRSVWNHDLPVPQRSQMLSQYRGMSYGGGGEVWCSPTSTSMVMAYWSQVLHQSSLDQSVPDAARDTYDYTYEGTGNWPFNTAYAAEFGLKAFVSRFYSLSQLEAWIKARVPIVISVAYQQGELPGAPVPAVAGHLMVVRGFAGNGDVIVNDPAAEDDAGVRITYPRHALETAWLHSSHGTVYIIYPTSWLVPTLG
ncbi:peptidase C39 family protein [Ktedonosporobacter rubrisoli]|uniref:Peptidase C39 family protein n=1 Tax=Ktedonosporobacter rubrisoli TaxID=2509675 RepID=A0A4P6JKI5_KTERU|nr:peptidase C39 family protein [Ktedonosporobacter rubrisoli]QBD75669.1 peptidase C39 family protein [Ktedonosporobacter rubrisoli]